MPFLVDGLTVEDFLASGWRTTVEGVEERDCLHYRSAFYARADEARGAGDAKQTNLFALFGDLASMFLDADDPSDPIKPMWQGGGQRSAIPSDFDPALPLLAEILPHVCDPDLRARIADVLWIRRRDYKAAREAAAAYLDSAHLADGEAWPDATERVQRAIEIAARTGQRELLDEVVRRLEEGLAAFTGAEASALPAHLMELLQGRKAGDPTKYAALAASFAAAAEGRGDWHTARMYWDAQAEWHKLAKDEEAERTARLQSAETYVSEADSRAGESQGQMVAAHFTEKAIHALRAVGGQKERILDLHTRLLAHQKNTVSEMGTISVDFDASELVAQATAKVAGKSLHDAILAFALLCRPAKVASLRTQAERHRQEFVFRRFASSRTVNAMGRTVARRDPAEVGETEDEADLRTEMYRIASQTQAVQAQAVIEPARAQILREHTVRVADLMPFVRDNPLVPQGREEFFARGLQAGFRGDFAAAVHLLVPQVENSVRYLLEQCDVITSGLDGEGIQDERDLNRTLRLPEFAGPLATALGGDTVFDLRGLLIERYGSNLRNDMAHGLLDYEAFYSGSAIYFWWLTLRLCCTPVIAAIRAAQRADSGGTGADSTEDVAGGEGGEADG